MSDSKERLLLFVNDLANRKLYLLNSIDNKSRIKKISRNIFAAQFIFRGLLYQLLLEEWSNDYMLVRKAIKKFYKDDFIERLHSELGIISFEQLSSNSKHPQFTKKYELLSLIGWITLENDILLASLLDWANNLLSNSSRSNTFTSKNTLWHKIQYFAKKHYNYIPSVITDNKLGVFETVIWLNKNKCIISKDKNFKKSRKLAFKKSMNYLLEIEQTELMKNNKYLSLMEEKRQKKEIKMKKRKEKIQEQHIKYIEEREEKRLARKKIFLQEKEIKFKSKSYNRKSKH